MGRTPRGLLDELECQSGWKTLQIRCNQSSRRPGRAKLRSSVKYNPVQPHRTRGGGIDRLCVSSYVSSPGMELFQSG